MKKKRCLITGSSKGLGRALVCKYQSEGYEVIGVSRSHDSLSDLWICADLSTAESVDVILKQVKSSIDVFICNAGVNISGAFESNPFENITKTLSTNLVTPMMLIQGLMNGHLLEQRSSCIWVSSLAVSMSYPGSAVYGASKKGLSDFVKQIEMIMSSNLHHMVVYPGPMDTLQAVKNSPSPEQKKSWATPDAVADKIFYGMCRRKRYLYPASGLWILAKIVDIWPYLGEKIMEKTVWQPMQKKARDLAPCHVD